MKPRCSNTTLLVDQHNRIPGGVVSAKRPGTVSYSYYTHETQAGDTLTFFTVTELPIVINSCQNPSIIQHEAVTTTSGDYAPPENGPTPPTGPAPEHTSVDKSNQVTVVSCK